MVRNYVRKTQRGKWSEENMKKAIDDIKNKKLSIRQAAEQHGVPKSTLERHWKGRVVHPGKVNLGKYKQALNSDLEEELVEHVKKMQEMFFGLTGETLRALAFQLANANGIPVPFNINNQKAGKDWLSCFLKRHRPTTGWLPIMVNVFKVSSLWIFLHCIFQSGYSSESCEWIQVVRYNALQPGRF
ncbi:unnamed protein product [Clavelina lepadiformis]|uniref:HTH CENPB-type domain-containing protein n=1 Tax=Clavelina lepadiformis TaxID=159417 RepID=A0ABP0F7R7_CLALP